MQTSGAIVFTGILALLGAAFAVLWIVALIDLFQRDEWDFPPMRPGVNPRVVWAVIVLLFSGFGALAYYVLVMRTRPRRR